jgi:RNA polymerase subunit RPABC4/transcription elongation factor Spt4
MANHLTGEQKEKAGAWLSAKVKACPVCGSKDLSLEEIVVVNPFWDGEIHGGAESLPLLQVACKNCLHVLHFAAKTMGL